MSYDYLEFKDTLLSNSSILYFNSEVDPTLNNKLQEFFENTYFVKNSLEAINSYENNKNHLNLILCELSHDGLKFMKHIRSIDTNIPIVLYTSFSSMELLVSAIKLQITDYSLQPMQLGSTLKIILNILNKNHNISLIHQQNNELANYKRAIDSHNMISRTDLNGLITEVNDMFCEVSGFSRSELIGKNHNIIRHTNNSTSFYTNLWNTIKSGKIWISQIKCLAKDSSVFHTKVTIIPILNLNNEIKEYISIRHLINDEIEEKQNLKRIILKQKSMSFNDNYGNKFKIKEEINLALKENNINHQKQINSLNELIYNLKNELKTTRAKHKEEKARVYALDIELKENTDKFDTQVNIYKKRFFLLNNISQEAVKKYEQIKKKNKNRL